MSYAGFMQLNVYIFPQGAILAPDFKQATKLAAKWGWL